MLHCMLLRPNHLTPLSCFPHGSETIDRTAHAPAVTVQYVSVNPRRFDVPMVQQRSSLDAALRPHSGQATQNPGRGMRVSPDFIRATVGYLRSRMRAAMRRGAKLGSACLLHSESSSHLVTGNSSFRPLTSTRTLNQFQKLPAGA